MVGTYNRKNFIFEQQTQTCTYKVNIIELTENKIYSIYIELKIFYNTYLFSWRSVELTLDSIIYPLGMVVPKYLCFLE